MLREQQLWDESAPIFIDKKCFLYDGSTTIYSSSPRKIAILILISRPFLLCSVQQCSRKRLAFWKSTRRHLYVIIEENVTLLYSSSAVLATGSMQFALSYLCFAHTIWFHLFPFRYQWSILVIWYSLMQQPKAASMFVLLYSKCKLMELALTAVF